MTVVGERAGMSLERGYAADHELDC